MVQRATGPELELAELLELQVSLISAVPNQGIEMPLSIRAHPTSHARRTVILYFILGTLSRDDLVLADENVDFMVDNYERGVGKDPFALLHARAHNTHDRMAREMYRPTWPLLRLTQLSHYALDRRDPSMGTARRQGATWEQIGREIDRTESGARRLGRRLGLE
jgi:hypothetical protein